MEVEEKAEKESSLPRGMRKLWIIVRKKTTRPVEDKLLTEVDFIDYFVIN